MAKSSVIITTSEASIADWEPTPPIDIPISALAGTGESLIPSIKKEAKQTMNDLHKMGVTTHMFTGDKKEVAQAVAKEIGIQEVKYEMLVPVLSKTISRI